MLTASLEPWPKRINISTIAEPTLLGSRLPNISWMFHENLHGLASSGYVCVLTSLDYWLPKVPGMFHGIPLLRLFRKLFPYTVERALTKVLRKLYGAIQLSLLRTYILCTLTSLWKAVERSRLRQSKWWYEEREAHSAWLFWRKLAGAMYSTGSAGTR